MNNLCVAHRGFSSIAPENTMVRIPDGHGAA